MAIRDGAGGKEGGCNGNGGGHSEAVKLTQLLTWNVFIWGCSVVWFPLSELLVLQRIMLVAIL